MKDAKTKALKVKLGKGTRKHSKRNETHYVTEEAKLHDELDKSLQRGRLK